MASAVSGLTNRTGNSAELFVGELMSGSGFRGDAVTHPSSRSPLGVNPDIKRSFMGLWSRRELKDEPIGVLGEGPDTVAQRR